MTLPPISVILEENRWAAVGEKAYVRCGCGGGGPRMYWTGAKTLVKLLLPT